MPCLSRNVRRVRHTRPMTTRTRVAYSLALTSLAGALALSGCAASNTAGEVSASPTATKKKPTATSTPSPSYTRKTSSPTPTPKPSQTKTKPVPEFIASLPATVNAEVGQEVIVQVPTEADDKFTATASGPVTLSGPRFNPPPPEQPDAPGTTIATIKVKDTGKATVTFVSAKGTTKKLTVIAK